MAWLWLKSRDGAGLADILAAHAAGADQSASLSRLGRRRGASLEQALAAMLPCVAGPARQRLSRLALDLGFVARWHERARSRDAATRKQALHLLAELPWGAADSTLSAALADREESVRLEACRAALRRGARSDLERVFAWALAQPAAVRHALAPELQPHALALCEGPIGQALGSDDPRKVAAALEFIARWGKALPLPDLRPLLHNPDAGIRARALHALVYDGSLRPAETEILYALWDQSAEVRAAACLAAARLRLEPALPAILRCLRDPDAALARTAACALAEMGPRGLLALENAIRFAWNPAAAAAALQAVEEIRTSRYGYARL